MTILKPLAVVLAIAANPALAQDEIAAVKVETVETESAGLSRQFFGQVVAKQTVDLAFQVAGRIVELPVVEGDPVATGSLIARLDLEPFELALDQARLQKEQADRDVTRLEQLRGTVSQVTIDDAITQAGLAALEVRTAEYNLEQATIVAPFDGLIASRSVANFTTVSVGVPIVRLHDMSDLRIDIDVPEVLVQRTGSSDKVTITAKFPSDERDFPLEVREINAETSSIGQTYRVTLGMDPPDDFSVLPGSSVTVSAQVNITERKFIVPPSAVLIAADGGTSVFKFNPRDDDTGVLERIPVKVRPTDDGKVAVIFGLGEGDEVVVAGVPKLTDGQLVRRFAGFGN